MKIKICGLTTTRDCEIVNHSGADYAGMVLFYEKSKRNLSPEAAHRLLRHLASALTPVAVTVSPTAEQVQIIEALGFQVLQVHGTLSPEVRAACHLPIWRAVNEGMQDGCLEAGSTAYVSIQEDAHIQAVLLDSRVPGSGRTFDWDRTLTVPEGKWLVLAGGLTAENVAAGIERFSPDVVDVSSGVEGPLGKDKEKVQEFVRQVRLTEKGAHRKVGMQGE